MSDESSNQNLIVGAAVVAGILGTLSAFIYSNKGPQSWVEHGGHAPGETFSKNMLLGGVAGGLIGATAALLLAPKAGGELIKDIASTLTHSSGLDVSTSSPIPPSKTSSSRASRSKEALGKKLGKEKKELPSGEDGKRQKLPLKKKAAPRPNTAVAAPIASAEPEEISSV